MSRPLIQVKAERVAYRHSAKRGGPGPLHRVRLRYWSTAQARHALAARKVGHSELARIMAEAHQGKLELCAALEEIADALPGSTG